MSETLDYEQQLLALSDKRMSLSNKYAASRKEYGETKAAVDILYAGNILKLQEKKKNLGYETGLLMMMAQEVGSTLQELYKKMIVSYNNYKAIERLIESHDSRIMALQSIMRYNRKNDGGM